MLTVIRLGLPNKTSALAWLHQRYREPDGSTAAGLPQRQTLAQCTNGFAMDWYRNAGGREELPAFEGSQALPILRAALLRHQQALLGDKPIASKDLAA